MSARKPKATNVISLAAFRRPSVGSATPQPDADLMKKIRLVVWAAKR